MTRVITINQLPAAGGTIVAKFLAANKWFINSEVSPNSIRTSRTFSPGMFADLLLDQGVPDDKFKNRFREKLFCENVDSSIEMALFYSRNLGIRIWHHPSFTADGAQGIDRASQLINSRYNPLVGHLVILRNPIDNFLSF